jgi:diguanylate cyclase
MNHGNRSAAFAMLFAVLGSHMVSRNYSAWVWSLLALQFFVYPHLIYWRALRARDGTRAELNNLVLDALLFGVWAAALQFPLWISFTLFISITVNHAAFLGLPGIFPSLAALICGTLIPISVHGLRLSPTTDWPTTLLCIASLSTYLLAVASAAFSRNHKLQMARKQLRLGEHTLNEVNTELQRQLEVIGALQTQLSEQANRDPLTGLYNRRYMDATLARELARCEREGQPLSLMMIDIDHFKQVNDSHGHPAGDEVLKSLATLLQKQARTADAVCRYGGEEFLLLLPNMPSDITWQRAEQWRRDFAASHVLYNGVRLQATLSVGLACYPSQGRTAQELIRGADRALYCAKTQGRNRVVWLKAEPAST